MKKTIPRPPIAARVRLHAQQNQNGPSYIVLPLGRYTDFHQGPYQPFNPRLHPCGVWLHTLANILRQIKGHHDVTKYVCERMQPDAARVQAWIEGLIRALVKISV